MRAGTTPPSELAAILGIELIAVKGLADHLEAAGADISRHPILGYTLVHEPDALSAEIILSHIQDAWRPQIETVTSTGSTNADAFQRGSRDDTKPRAEGAWDAAGSLLLEKDFGCLFYFARSLP